MTLYATLKIPIFFDEGDRQPTCAINFSTHEHCQFYRTARFGSYETCLFAPEENERPGLLERRPNKGGLIPGEWCPLHKAQPKKVQKSKQAKQFKTFEIWMEGFNVTGNTAQARFLGLVTAASFKDACVTFFTKENQEKYGTFNPETLSAWGCRLFPTEEEARASFG